MADNKKYYWLKLKEDFFEEKQIRYLRKLPDGDKLVIAYLKMQLKSLRTEGFIKYDQIMPSNEEELAMILDEDINIIKLMLQALIKVKAIEVLDDGSFYLIAMQELVGKEGESAERVRQFRQRQKQLALQCNNAVTNCNTEIEIEKEKEIKKELETEKKIEKRQNVVELYNSTCTNLPQVKKNTDKRNKAIDKFIKTFSEDEIEEIFRTANDSEFLTGENDRGWKADFDFIMRIDKATAILEGKYDNKKKTGFEDLQRIWEEAKIEDEQAGNNTNNSTFSW